MDLPVYKCVIDQELETDLQVEYIAFVPDPAIQKNFLAFNEAKSRLKFNVDTERRIVSGPAMLADMLIYRNDPEGLGEYYTVFDKETILSIVQKFFKKGFGQNFNLMHNPDEKPDGITVYESFLTDESRGIKPMKGYEDAADGSWFITAKIDNEQVWEKVKKGEVKGFSVEGIFRQIPVKKQVMSAEQIVAGIKQLLSQMPA